jgi:hypothetical protein
MLGQPDAILRPVKGEGAPAHFSRHYGQNFRDAVSVANGFGGSFVDR